MDSGVRVSLRPEETPLSKAELLRELARREKIHESRVKFKVTLQGARAQSEQWLAEALAAQALSPNAEADTEVFNCRHNIDNYTASIERTTDLIASAKDGVSEARHAVGVAEALERLQARGELAAPGAQCCAWDRECCSAALKGGCIAACALTRCVCSIASGRRASILRLDCSRGALAAHWRRRRGRWAEGQGRLGSARWEDCE
jgi:hypothetical protein